MNAAFCSIDWAKVAHVLQALLTPAIGIATVLIGAIAIQIQRQQAATNRLQYRLALFERRMKVFDAKLEFIELVLRKARIETPEPLNNLTRDTREQGLLFELKSGNTLTSCTPKARGCAVLMWLPNRTMS